MRDVLEKIFEKREDNILEGRDENSWPAPNLRNKEKQLRSAAVLIPILEHNSGFTILLTQRTETMSNHPGQIAFPGGTKEAAESTPEETALRETEEEIGISSADVNILGRMSARDTATGYRVMPIVGLITPPVSLKLAPSEVASVFEVPIEFIVNPSSHSLETREKCGKSHKYYVMPYNDYYIWGLTARILVELGTMLRKT